MQFEIPRTQTAFRNIWNGRFGSIFESRFYCFLLVNEYVGAAGQPTILNGENNIEEYLQLDINQRIELCVKYAFLNFYRATREEFDEFVEEIVVIMESHHDAWDEPQLPTFKLPIYRFILFAEVRHDLCQCFPLTEVLLLQL